MPKDMPNEFYALGDLKNEALELYELVKVSKYPERELKQSVDKLRAEMSSKKFYELMGTLCQLFAKDDNQYIVKCAEYVKMLYGGKYSDTYFKRYGRNDRMYQESPIAKEVAVTLPVSEIKKLDELDVKVNFGTVVNYALEDCVKYDDVKAIYDMLVEMMDGIKNERWVNAKNKLKARMKKLSSGVNIGRVDELVLEKHVENEVQNVETGGTGISIKK